MTTVIIGNVTRDPVPSWPRHSGRRATPIDDRTGLPIVRTTFGVIVTSADLDPGMADPERETTRIEVSCQKALAEHVIEGIRRGDRVIVTGRIEEVPWESSTGSHTSPLFLASDVGLSLRKHQLAPPEPDDEAGDADAG